MSLSGERGTLSVTRFVQQSPWGHKYAPFDKDAAFGAAVAAREKLPVFKSPLLAEGGGVTVDGEGTIITTETCFLNRNRNPSPRDSTGTPGSVRPASGRSVPCIGPGTAGAISAPARWAAGARTRWMPFASP